MEDTGSRRIIVLGKTGTGKSSLANTIFGEKDSFEVSTKSISGTKVCVSKTKNIYGKNIQLIDTPGLFDTDPKSTELSPELLKCVTECAPGPHAFLLVLKVDRYTRQEQAIIDVILKYFSDEALKYTTVVFTYGDQLQEGVNIRDWAKENKALETLLEKCGGRCHVFDNRRWNESQDPYRNNQYQVSELLKTIEQTVKENGGRCYTNDMLQKIHNDIQQEVQQVSSSGITIKDILQDAKDVVYAKIKTNMEGAVVGIVLGALVGAGVMVEIVVRDDPNLIQYVGKALLGGAVGGTTGILVGVSEKTPTQLIQDATKFLSVLEQLFNQWHRTWNAARHPPPSPSGQ